MGPWRVTAVAICLTWLSTGCGEEPPSPTPSSAEQPAAAPVKAVQPEPPTAPVTAEPEAEEPLEFVYDPEGLRDPFQPFIKIEPKKKPQQPKAFVPKTPLQRYAVEELRLVGVVWAGAGSRALIEDPEGKGYVVGSGTLVGDRGGKIVRVQPERVVIEERFVDLFGEENVNTVEMTLKKSEDEVTP